MRARVCVCERACVRVRACGWAGGRARARACVWVCVFLVRMGVLGDSGGVVNSLHFCLASLKTLGCFYFRCVLSSQWKAVTVNLRILHCQL